MRFIISNKSLGKQPDRVSCTKAVCKGNGTVSQNIPHINRNHFSNVSAFIVLSEQNCHTDWRWNHCACFVADSLRCRSNVLHYHPPTQVVSNQNKTKTSPFMSFHSQPIERNPQTEYSVVRTKLERCQITLT